MGGRSARLPAGRWAILGSLALGAVLWLMFAQFLFPAIAGSAHLSRSAAAPGTVAVFAFQALNEEIVLGSLLLFAVVGRTGRPLLAAWGVAAIFAVVHHLLYRFGAYRTALHPSTLLALAAVGAVRNALILLAGHVGYAWALHAAWNVVMFSGQWRAGPRVLAEPAVMDAFVGAVPVATAACVAAVALGWMLARRGAAQGAMRAA